MVDFLIIGGGISAMLTARELTQAGAKVVIVEKGVLGKESSWAGGGILSPLYPWRYDDAVTALAVWSQTSYPLLAGELAEETGIDPQWIRSGLLILDHDEAVSAIEWAKRHDVEVVELDRAATLRCEPVLSSVDAPSLWFPQVGQIRNPRLLKALRVSLDNRGVRFIERSEVTDLLISKGRVSGVVADSDTFTASAVIVAAGAWAAQLLARSGVSVNVFPVRGQMLLFRAKPGLLTRIVLKNGHYLIPRRDGRILVGSTVEYTGFDKSTTPEAMTVLQQAAIELVPLLVESQLERHWAGLRPGSGHGVPFIGAFPDLEGLYINAGHFRNGVVMGPGAAHLLADIILKRPPIVDPRSYSVIQP